MATIIGKLGLDASAWHAGIDGAKRSLGPLAASMGAAFSVGAILSFGRSITRMASQISDAARDAQMSTDAYQALAAVMQDAGIKAEKSQQILGRLNATQEEAASTNGKARQAMLALGLSQDEITGSTEGLIEAIARGYAATGDYAALVDIFGRRDAPAMQEALERLDVEGFGNLIDGMKDAGRVMEDDFIESLDRADDVMNTFGQRLKIFAAEGISRLMDLGRTIGAFFKGTFTNEKGEFGFDLSRGIQAAGDKVAEIDAEKEKADEVRRAKREERDKQDEDRRRRAFEASERDPEARQAAARGGSMAASRAPSADELRRIGANFLGAGRAQPNTAEQQIAKASAESAKIAKESLTVLQRIEQKDSGGARF